MTSLKDLNARLADFPYVGGYTPSQADVEQYNALTYVRRWIKHLDSFTEAEFKTFPKTSQNAAKSAAPSKPEPKKGGDDDDDDLDLFGDDDDEEAEKAKAERAAKMEAQKKGDKKAVVAKSNVILDVKVWDDETDLKAVEEQVRKIELDGLLWGVAKTVPLAFGVSKLQIVCVVEDEKVSIDDLTERIEELEDVQSTDIAAFQKI